MSRLLLAALLLTACRPTTVVTPTEEKDADKDGVSDSSDACPEEPGVAPDGCPARDGDGDAVADPDDKCPTVPGPPPDGCPITEPPPPLDTDGDGIPDPDDRCPNEPEDFNGREDRDGCPDSSTTRLPELGLIHPAQFATNASTLSATMKRQLDQLAALLTQMPGVQLTLSGHADAQERSPAALSQRRAEAVRERLIAGGVAEARLTVRGAGADEPIADNATEAGRAKNRRVDLTITAQ